LGFSNFLFRVINFIPILPAKLLPAFFLFRRVFFILPEDARAERQQENQKNY